MQRWSRSNRGFVAVVLGLVGAVACGGGSAAPQPDGPPHLGILSGNNQKVGAAHAVALPSEVVAQAVRLPNGTVAMRVLDAMLPRKAYAQTAVNGIPGLTVCATQPDPKHALTAVVPCASTDATGKAYFTFRADTVAGVSTALVAASLSTGIKVTDSVSATITPDAASLDFWAGPAFDDPAHQVYAHQDAGNATISAYSAHVGDVIDLTGFIAKVQDKYSNVLTGYALSWAVTQVSTTPFTTSGKVNDWLYWPPASTPAAAATGTGPQVTGFAPGYARITVFVNGQRMSSYVLLAVF